MDKLISKSDNDGSWFFNAITILLALRELQAGPDGSSHGPVPLGGQENAARSQQEDTSAQQNEGEYASEVGDIQARAVDAFLNSHRRFLHYDAITAEDVDEIQATEAAFEELTNQVDNLDPPEKYKEQHEVFGSALDELHEATKLAHSLVADPTKATYSDFDEYDRHVNEATRGLQRSNDILGGTTRRWKACRR